MTSSPLTLKNNRPELNDFSLQQQKIDILKDMTKIQTKPKFSAFAQVGYGRPGFNMFYTDFDKFYFFAAKLNWNIWDWKQKIAGKNKSMISRSSIIETQKETFNKNVQVSLEKELSDIQKYEELVKLDNEIIEVRNKICQ